MSSFIDFAKKIGELKLVKRTGWITFGRVKDPESVADHTMRLASLALVAGDELGVDRRRLVDMAIVHDFAESIVGDIVHEYADKELPNSQEKSQAEHSAIKELLKGLENGNEFLEMWEEFEDQKTEEAMVLKQLDKFEMVLQALEYEEVADPKNFEPFWINAKKHIRHPVIKKWLKEIEKQKKK